MNKKLLLTTRILGTIILLISLPFYFGYGNPLPFANPQNSLLDNIWLTTFPIIFIGLALGWKYPKLAGFLLIIPTTTATILGIIIQNEGIPGPMFAPIVLGFLYIISAYKN